MLKRREPDTGANYVQRRVENILMLIVLKVRTSHLGTDAAVLKGLPGLQNVMS